MGEVKRRTKVIKDLRSSHCKGKEPNSPLQPIVKVQLAQASNVAGRVGSAFALIYDKDRIHVTEQPIPMNVYKIVAVRHPQKAYFRASWSSVVGWGISVPAIEDQDW